MNSEKKGVRLLCLWLSKIQSDKIARRIYYVTSDVRYLLHVVTQEC